MSDMPAAPTATSDDLTLAWGSWLATFLDQAKPAAAAVGSLFYRKFAPGLMQAFVRPDQIEGYITAAIDKFDAMIDHDSITIPAHLGVFADVVRQATAAVPAFEQWILAELSPIVRADLQSIGAL